MLQIKHLQRQDLLAVLSEKSVRFIDMIEHRVVYELLFEGIPFQSFLELENLSRSFCLCDISHDPGTIETTPMIDQVIVAVSMLAPEGHSSCVQLYLIRFQSISLIESKLLHTIEFRECVITATHIVPHATGWDVLVASKLLVGKQKSRVIVYDLSMGEKGTSFTLEKKSKRRVLSPVMSISHLGEHVLLGTHDESVYYLELQQHTLHFINAFVFFFFPSFSFLMHVLIPFSLHHINNHDNRLMID